jgi:hypothetical protein
VSSPPLDTADHCALTPTGTINTTIKYRTKKVLVIARDLILIKIYSTLTTNYPTKLSFFYSKKMVTKTSGFLI